MSQNYLRWLTDCSILGIVCLRSPELSFLANNFYYMGQLPKNVVETPELNRV